MAQLNSLHKQVTQKINSGADVAYWESLAEELRGTRARVSLQVLFMKFLIICSKVEATSRILNSRHSGRTP